MHALCPIISCPLVMHKRWHDGQLHRPLESWCVPCACAEAAEALCRECWGPARLDSMHARMGTAWILAVTCMHQSVQGLGAEVVYVSGRTRRNGEMNGKSGNLNNCARQLYPAVRLCAV